VDRPDLDLLRGAIDMHAHTHPALFRRPLDDADLARIATEYGMRGFVLKDHDSLTTGRAYYVNKMFDRVEAYGAIVLNRSVGGLDPHVVQAAIHYGAKVIWMPSNHSKWHAEYFQTSDYPQLGRPKRQLPGPGVTVLDEDGRLKPEVLTILDLVAEADVCLATGHLSPQETRLLLDEAIRRGVRKFLVTHANWALTRYDVEEQKEFIRKGAFLEYVAVSCVSPIFYEQKPAELAAWIKELGGHNLVLSSDLGQLSGPPHPEGLRMLVAALLDEGVPFDVLAKMLRHNPAALLNLEPE
jgi:predicted TIM-barrel fold metal-dependent hydrolase